MSKKINELNLKVTPVAGDSLIIADSEDLNGSIPRTKRISATSLSSIINHENILNIGTNTHAQIDTHIADDSKHTATVVSNVVIVDPNLPTVNGKIYRTWATADAYVAAQSPSVSNRWIIQINGTNSEDIVMKSFVSIIGKKGMTVLTGDITTTVPLANTKYTYIKDCELRQMSMNNTSNAFYVLNCELFLTSGVLGAGNIFILDSTIHSGTFSASITSMEVIRCNVLGGSFTGRTIIDSLIKADVASGPSFSGGIFNECQIIADPLITWNTGFQYRFYDSSIPALTWTLTALSDIEFNNCHIQSSTFDIPAVPVKFETNGCSTGTISITGAEASSWSNKGNLFDNSDSGLSSTETNAAINELASTRIKIVEEELTSMSGASVSTTSLIPAGALVLAVTTRVTTLIEGATEFDIGDGTDVDKWGDAIAVAADTTTDGTDFTDTSVSIFPAGGDVTLTGDVSFTAGAVKVRVYYIDFVSPTS